MPPVLPEPPVTPFAHPDASFPEDVAGLAVLLSGPAFGPAFRSVAEAAAAYAQCGVALPGEDGPTTPGWLGGGPPSDVWPGANPRPTRRVTVGALDALDRAARAGTVGVPPLAWARVVRDAAHTAFEFPAGEPGQFRAWLHLAARSNQPLFPDKLLAMLEDPTTAAWFGWRVEAGLAVDALPRRDVEALLIAGGPDGRALALRLIGLLGPAA